MEDIKKLLRSRKINFNKLLGYGFIKKEDKYEYEDVLIKDEFDIKITFFLDERFDYQVIDLIEGEEYMLVKVTGASGGYVGKVRKAVFDKLKEIIMKCSSPEIFKSVQTKQVIGYIREKYYNEPEFLWKESDGNAVFRHKENKKWYGVLMTVQKSKFGLEDDEITEAINLKMAPEEIEKIIDNKRYFPAYHMNKEHWLSLSEEIPLSQVFSFIDESYQRSY